MRTFLTVVAGSLAVMAMPAAAEVHFSEGAGAASCAKFASSYRNDPEVAEEVYFTWAQGYMSGMNAIMVATSKKFADINSMSTESEESFLRDYCDQHPLSDYQDGVMALYLRLKPTSYTGDNLTSP